LNLAVRPFAEEFMRTSRPLLSALLLLLLTPAAGFAQNKCAGEKIKAAGKKATCKSGLEAHQASRGGTIDPAKVAKCEAKFSSAFAKSEAKGGCTTTGDAATLEAKVDAFVADLDTELAVGTLPNKCQGEKIKAAGKKASCKADLEAKQAARDGTIDPAKVAKCEAKFSSAFAKQEAGGACNTTGDAGVIEAKVDAFVADVDIELNPPACCNIAPGVCLGVTKAKCESTQGTVGPPGSVCDNSGSCVTPPGTPGGCCTQSGGGCAAGSATCGDQPTCLAYCGGTSWVPSAICMPDGSCQ
jgi:hypothetical protein